MKLPLSAIAHTRSGDKGDMSNIGVIAWRMEDYPLLLQQVTAERVRAHFGPLVQGPVERFELPNLGALNFLLHEALDGGGTLSLRIDAQGKNMGSALLAMEIECGPDFVPPGGPRMLEIRQEHRLLRLTLDHAAVLLVRKLECSPGFAPPRRPAHA